MRSHIRPTRILFIYLFSAFAAAAILVRGSDAFARPDCNSCHSDCGSRIITYNPDNHRTLSADVMQLVKATQAEGHGPLSCIRTQTCQNQLISCYNACGQAGRAARHSEHTDGTACDWNANSSGYLSQIRSRLGLNNMQQFHHPASQGGGLHDYTLRYVASGAYNGAGGSVSYASDAATRQPAGAPSGATTFANGKYNCPSGMNSICGSTRDTPWCQSWISSGHTPGCFN